METMNRIVGFLILSIFSVHQTSYAILLGGDVEVKTPTGYTKVSDLQPGDVVKTFNGKKFCTAKVEKCWAVPFKVSEMRFIEIAGMIIKISPSATTITEVYPKITWKEIDSGDKVFLISYLPYDQWDRMLRGGKLHGKSEIRTCKNGIYNLFIDEANNLVITRADILISWF